MSMDFAARGRPELHLTVSDVGKRVSVRRIAEVVAGRPVFRDAVGVLTSWNDGVLIVTRRTGEAVHIAENSVVAGKVVPDTPLRRGIRAPRATAQELQEIASRDWPAQETERLGDWVLRAAGGFTRRANSVLPFGDPGIPVAAAAGRIVEWYAARGLPGCVQVTDEGLDAELAALGWTNEAEALLRTAPLPPLANLPGAERVRLSREVDADWLARYHRTGALGEEAVKVLTGGPSVWFATVPGTEGPAAIGRCVVDGAWAMFGAVEVDPAARRQGLATAVMAALALRAVAEGASGAYLQVEADNEGARSMYDRLGFTTHHAYHYRRAPKG
jgi:GNAT superfamily N-acetyltransferase/sRNA-binding carbon storage regulator CsrA